MSAIRVPRADPTPARVPPAVIGLDLLRFCAAAMVMVFHIGFWFSVDAKHHLGWGGVAFPHPPWTDRFWFGWVGVEVFFVLSGYVIALSAATASAVQFLRGRALRLVPAAWICATMTALVVLAFAPAALDRSDLGLQWLRSIAFVPVGPWVDWSYWTLAIELSFYTLVFLALAAGVRAYVTAIVVTIGLASSLFWLWPLVGPPGLPVPDLLRTSVSGSTERAQELLLLRHGCFFALGALLHSFARQGRSWLFLVAVPILIPACLLEIMNRTALLGLKLARPFDPSVPLLVWIAAIAAIAAAVPADAALRRLLGAWRPLARHLGLVTYPLYLLHQVIGFAVLQSLGALGGSSAVLAAVMLLLLGLAFAVSVRFEPALRARMIRAGRVLRGWVRGGQPEITQSA